MMCIFERESTTQACIRLQPISMHWCVFGKELRCQVWLVCWNELSPFIHFTLRKCVHTTHTFGWNGQLFVCACVHINALSLCVYHRHFHTPIRVHIDATRHQFAKQKKATDTSIVSLFHVS